MKTRRTRVYVAGPITKGDQFLNARNGILAGKTLYDNGYAPYVPHLTCFWHAVAPMPYDAWITMDNEWLPVCDALLRLPGESPGADKEVQFAHSLDIPVYYSMEVLLGSLTPVQEVK